MILLPNDPLDTYAIEALIKTRADLFLVWPQARFPFDHRQWQEALDPENGNKSFFLHDGRRRIGHAALRATETPNVYAVSFLYLLPEERSSGLGQKLIGLVERYARTNMAATGLTLVVRTYNPAALECYLKCGFEEDDRSNTLIRMSKSLRGESHERGTGDPAKPG